jgi:ubiquinol-cytochrome c reductase iron-sulfur subunit
VSDRATERLIAAIFVAAGLAGAGLLLVYAVGGQTQIEGLLLAISLGGIGLGTILWAQRLLPEELTIQRRHRLASEPEAASDPDEVAGAEMTRSISRRTLLLRSLAAAIAGLGAALAIPVLSLGPAPVGPKRATGWQAGTKLVDSSGRPVRATALPLDGIVTVFPEGSPGSAIGQAVLLRVDPNLLRLPADRAGWAPNGYLAFSKVCTHAGCPVGLYRTEEHRLLCPCHQSTFDVLVGAIPSSGPAARPLPQLPLTLNADGTIAAVSDFPDPVGPSVWNIHDG